MTFWNTPFQIDSDDARKQTADSTAECYIYGNIMSLVDEDNFSTATTVGEKAFYCLFLRNTNLLSHSTKKLVLPATSLAKQCYFGMFSGCTGLNKVTCHATDISAGGSTTSWLSDVACTGTFIMAENMDAWENGANGIPEGWIRKELTEYH